VRGSRSRKTLRQMNGRGGTSVFISLVAAFTNVSTSMPRGTRTTAVAPGAIDRFVFASVPVARPIVSSRHNKRARKFRGSRSAPSPNCFRCLCCWQAPILNGTLNSTTLPRGVMQSVLSQALLDRSLLIHGLRNQALYPAVFRHGTRP